MTTIKGDGNVIIQDTKNSNINIEINLNNDQDIKKYCDEIIKAIKDNDKNIIKISNEILRILNRDKAKYDNLNNEIDLIIKALLEKKKKNNTQKMSLLLSFFLALSLIFSYYNAPKLLLQEKKCTIDSASIQSKFKVLSEIDTAEINFSFDNKDPQLFPLYMEIYHNEKNIIKNEQDIDACFSLITDNLPNSLVLNSTCKLNQGNYTIKVIFKSIIRDSDKERLCGCLSISPHNAYRIEVYSDIIYYSNFRLTLLVAIFILLSYFIYSKKQ